MTRFLRQALREPLLHFLVVGFVLFIVGQHHRKQSDTYRIVVTPQREVQLATRYALQFGKPPDAATRAALVERDLEEEMLFRQGVALGLDQGDELVRRRIVQKMLFLLHDVHAPAEPAEEQLSAYYASHAERYTTPTRVTFSHIYFSSEAGDENARARAGRALHALETSKSDVTAGGSGGMSGFGDPFPDLSHFAGYDAEQVRRLFGPTQIAAAVFSAPAGRWAGPFKSSYGWHLIHIDRYQDAERQTLAAVRDKVRTDFLLDEQARVNRAALNDLAREFTVVRTKS